MGQTLGGPLYAVAVPLPPFRYRFYICRSRFGRLELAGILVLPATGCGSDLQHYDTKMVGVEKSGQRRVPQVVILLWGTDVFSSTGPET